MYFDSGCSRHIIGDKSFFINLTLMNDCLVTFGYDTKTLICGRGLISAQEIYKHKDVCSMKGLKTNLISINQNVIAITWSCSLKGTALYIMRELILW